MSIQQVYDHWNSKPKHFKWKTHGKLTSKMATAITDRLNNWTAEDLCGMIDNFYTCKTDDRFTIRNNGKWPKWSLSMFFTRGVKDGDLRCEWFEDEEFDEERWYTDKYKEGRTKQRQATRSAEQAVRTIVERDGDFIRDKSLDELKERREWRNPVFREAVGIIKSE